MIDPFIHIVLQRLEGPIIFLSEFHLIELLPNGFMEPIADAVGLERLDFCFRRARCL